MKATSKRRESDSTGGNIRASISVPEQQYSGLEKIAAENKVSLAWVIRDAIDGYLKSKRPVLPHGAVAKHASTDKLK